MLKIKNPLKGKGTKYIKRTLTGITGLGVLAGMGYVAITGKNSKKKEENTEKEVKLKLAKIKKLGDEFEKEYLERIK